MPFTETVRAGWSKPRAFIATDDTLVDAAADTMQWANLPAYAYKPSANQNALEIAFLMGVDGEACAATVFAARKNGDIVRVWTGTLTCGTMEDTGPTGLYVDTVASSTDTWITTIKEVDGGGADRMFRLVFDTCGYYAFFVQFTGLTGVEKAMAVYSGF